MHLSHNLSEAADDKIEVRICGTDVEKASANVNGLTYKGFGLLSCNSTNNLLIDYKYQAPKTYEQLLQTLFGGEHPLMNQVKIEMGNDGNNSTGADSCTMRSEDEEADASRSPGFILAADAKQVNPNVKVSILRWEVPKWVQEYWQKDEKGKGYQAFYRWYKETIFDAYEKYGYLPDYINPDKNETWSPNADFIKWFKNALVTENDFPAYMTDDAKEKYHQIKIIASDENTSLNIVPAMRDDSELYQAVDAIGFHYSTGSADTTKDYVNMADVDDKEVWYSEGCGSFSYSKYQKNKTTSYGAGTIGGYQSPLAMCDCMVKSAVYSRKTHYIFQPAIGSFYEGAQYDHKELLSAREPWAGSIHYDEAIYLLSHFSKFAKTGWENETNTAGIWRYISQASGNDSVGTEHLTNENGNPSYMTLASPDKKDFSTIIVNNSKKTLNYRISLSDMELPSGKTLEQWESATDQYMEYKGEIQADDSSYDVVVKPFSIVTVTSLSCHDKPEYLLRLPEEATKSVLDTNESGSELDPSGSVLYCDDFAYSSYPSNYLSTRGNEPRYFVDHNGAFYVENGKLVQGLNKKVAQWNSSEPNTVLGDYRWMNYKASIDVYPGETGSAGIVIRQQTGMSYSGSGYSLQINKKGEWKFMKRKSLLANGNLGSGLKDSYRLSLSAKGNKITAWIDGQEVSSYEDQKPEYFGRIRLFSAWEKTMFDNLVIEKLPSDGTVKTLPYAGILLDNADDKVCYSSGWDIKCNGSSNDWYRSTSKATKSGASFTFPLQGRGFALIGNNTTASKISVMADGKEVESSIPIMTSSNHGTSYLYYGLEDGEHQITVTVDSGNFILDAILPLSKTSPAVVQPDAEEKEEQDNSQGEKPLEKVDNKTAQVISDSLVQVSQKQTPKCNKTSIKLKKNKKKIRISWKKVKQASGYIIQRAKGKKGKFKTIKQVSGNKKTFYFDKKVEKGKTYRYRVRCFLKYQKKKIYSSFSKVKKIKA